MSAAAFVLAINLFVAFIFATAFGLAAVYARTAVGARWLSLAYGVGMANPILELLLPSQTDPRPVQVAIVLVFVTAIGLGVVGMARHYRLTPPWFSLGALLLGSLVLTIAIIDMPRSSTLRAVLYQLPYFTVYLVAVILVMSKRPRQALDQALLVLFALSALQFLTKPFLSAALGSGSSAQTYIGTTYAAVSQALGGMLLLATGLLMLLIIVRDAMDDMTARSETDTLSGLLNRRGFEEKADRLLASMARTGMRGTIIVADLDHFKSINDSYGHEAGDRVIAAFAEILAMSAGPRAVTGRLGGEEFAILMPDADLATARLHAERVRSSFAGLSIASLGPQRRVSASLGVAQLEAGDTLSDLLRRADAALYEAKKGGRDRVCVASPEAIQQAEQSPASAGRQGSQSLRH